MPPRYAYWTIIAGGLPTAFRTAERDELLPTFRRIQERHPDAEMKYFARGKLWASPEDARLAAEARRAAKVRGDRRPGAQAARGRDWRPGGEHRDPRQPFKDAKKARNLDRRRQRFEQRERREQIERKGAAAPGTRPGRPSGHGRPLGKNRPAAGKRDRRRS
ncbi:MAG: hypothetical protein ACRD3C_05135 [Vicinamibacterales bacterium]